MPYIETTGLNRFKDNITWIGVQINESIDDIDSKVYTFDYSNKSSRKKFQSLMKHLKLNKLCHLL